MGDRSVDARDISQSAVVTGDGNNVALNFGDTGIALPLRRRQFAPPDRRRQPRAGEPPRDLDLLVAETGKLPLIGRKDLFAELQAWLDADCDISVFALIGRAGTGKTRLAIEFCRSIDSDPTGKGEWIAGFLSPPDLSAFVETLATRDFVWQSPTFLVIDYAVQCHQALARWLDRLADQRLHTKLRFLLLEREAPEAFGWWHELTVLGPPNRRDLFYALRPRQLPDLSDLEERRALMTAALQAARELRAEASSSPPIPANGEDADFDRRLAQPQFGNPLNVVMAGVIALDRGPHAALALRRLDAARQIARREMNHRLKPLAGSRRIGEDTIRHIVAFNGLAGGLPIAGLRNIVYDELAASQRPTDRLNEMVELLEQEFPVRSAAIQEPRLATIQPDLIGEAVIVEAFTGGPSREVEAAEVSRRAYHLGGEAAAHALVRVMQDFGHAVEDPDATDAEKATGGRVLDWLSRFAQQIDDPDELVPLAVALPLHTTILREPAADLINRIASSSLSKAKQTNRLGDSANAAFWLNNLGVRLGLLGRREQALKEIQKAVRLYRGLAEDRPVDFRQGLARSLHNLGSRFAALERREEALAATEEAVRLRRDLAAEDPEAFIPDLARSLGDLGNRLRALGRLDEALRAAEEAVELYREVVKLPSEAVLPDFALALNNLAVVLRNLKRFGAAQDVVEEAIRHYEALAGARPDAFIPDLARSHHTLALVFRDLERRPEALATVEKAIRYYRVLARARPDVFDVELARSLWVLGDLHGDDGKPGLAVETLAEAICRLTPTFLQVPQAVAGMMHGIGQSYLSHCKAAGHKPDFRLLGPVQAVFQKLKQQEEEKR